MTYEAENELAQANAADGFGGQSDTVNAADLYTPEGNGASEQAEAPAQTDASPRGQASERTYTTEQMTNTVKERVNQLKRGAAYQLGRELLDEYMRANNLNSEADALSRIRDERIKAKAASYKDNPEQAFEELLRQREAPRVPEDETLSSEANAERIFSELTDEIRSGKVPKDFDITNYLSDPERAREFLGWRSALGIEQACSIAMRMNVQSTPSKTEQNRALPQPMGTNNSYNPKPVNVKAMTSEQFREYEKNIKRAHNSGKRVQF